MWRETTKHKRNRRIFDEEFESFLPEKILDFHVHVMNEGVLPAGRTYSCAGHPIAKYDLDNLAQDLDELYPRRKTSAVCFGFPDVDYDQKCNNDYVARSCNERFLGTPSPTQATPASPASSASQRFFPFRLFDPLHDTPEALHDDLVAKRFLGIKPYLNYVRKADPNDVEIREMLPGWVMEIADALGLIVMLHIPRKQRLADPLNQRQLVELCQTYPRARIVLAHIGRAYYLKNIAGHLNALRGLPNLYYDLAMLNNSEVLEYLFARVPPDRILYATDTPIALAPGKSVEINDQYTYITPVPWELSISDEHKKIVFTAFAYEELRAIKKAVERLGLERDFIEKIFFSNGMALL